MHYLHYWKNNMCLMFYYRKKKWQIARLLVNVVRWLALT